MKSFRFKIKPADHDERRREVDQIRGEKSYDLYTFVDLNGDKSTASFVTEFKNNGLTGLQNLIGSQQVLNKYMYNNGEGTSITAEEYRQWYREHNNIDTDDDHWIKNYKEDIKACWLLDQRGSLGETAVHVCFLNNRPNLHTKIAHTLLYHYPAMAWDKYEGEEYYGETSLHIAIVNGDLESVKLLVKFYGADVHARASGTFFLPEDCKPKIHMESDYQGYAYYGEYPASFAACFDNKDMYDTLVRHGADPNRQDTFGNTVLHLCVIHNKMEMYQHVLRRKHKTQADAWKVNYAGLTPIALAAKLGRIDMFNSVLELTCQQFWSFGYMNCSAYPLEGLDSIDRNGKSNPSSALRVTLQGNDRAHLDLLDTGIMFRLLEEKWKAFAKKRFYFRLMFAILYLVAFSLSIYLRPRDLNMKNIKNNLDVLRIASEAFTVLGALMFVFLEIKFVLISQGFAAQLRSLIDAPAKTLFLISCFLVIIACPLRYTDRPVAETHLLIVAAPMAWSYLLFFCRGFSAVGPFVGMIYKMCAGDMTRFCIIYFIFLAGSVQAFSYLMQAEPGFHNEKETFLSLIQMTFGEFEYFAFENSQYATLSKLVFFYFNLLVTVLLLNMLIAMMASTYQNIADHSEKEWRKQWAEIILVIEESISPKDLMRYQDDYSVDMKAEGSSQRTRGIMVIKKTEKQTKADARKAAVENWRILGKTSIKSSLRAQALS